MKVDKRHLLEDESKNEIQDRPSYVPILLMILFLIILSIFSFLAIREERYLATVPWDSLIFSQQWPSTYCQQWEEKSPDHTCRLPPPDQYAWTIHGIWPTKLGTKGPSFCDPSIKFNKESLTPIENDLNKQWLDVKSGTDPYEFWKHEWDKHGTCAMNNKSFSNEFEYFDQGLKWNSDYEIGNILAKAGIVPGTSDESAYSVYEYWNALTSNLLQFPYITCIMDKKTQKFYISEVRICFDRALNLMNCGGVGILDDFVEYWDSQNNRRITTRPQTNCPNDNPIIYRK